MNRTNACVTAALLFLLGLLPAAFAQNNTGPVVVIGSSPENPAVGATWTLRLLIDHPVPDEVTVRPPPFNEALFPDQLLKSPYAAGPQSNTGRAWTLVEYRFIPRGAGTITIDSFTVITPQGRTLTVPLTVSIQNSAGEPAMPLPRLTWQDLPSGLRVGTTARIKLRLNSWDSRKPLPEPALFMPTVPEGFIIEADPITAVEQNAGIVLVLKLIPLSASGLVLPGRSFTFANTLFEIPPLRISVQAAPKLEPDAENSGITATIEPSSLTRNDNEPFPAPESAMGAHPVLCALFRDYFEHTYNTANGLWNRGNRAESLALLRRNERDHPAGPLFASLRREAEGNAGLGNTGNEESPHKRLIFFLLSLGLTLVSLLLYIRFPPLSRRKKASLACMVLCSAATLVFLQRFIEAGGKFSGLSRSGLMKETFIRRIPDVSGEITGRFIEGQPIRLSTVSETSGLWVWVIANSENETGGWVEKERIVFY